MRTVLAIVLAVIALLLNDATTRSFDEPLAIVARKGSGIRPGSVEDLRGKRVGLAREQTSDEKAIQHIRYDPRIARHSLRAFEETQDDILRLTLTSAPARLPIPEQFNRSFMAEVERAYPQYFNDLPPLPADVR